MPINRKLRTIMLCLPLLLGSLAGAPMTPEEIENLLHAAHQQRLAYVLEDEEEKGESGLKGTTDGTRKRITNLPASPNR